MSRRKPIYLQTRTRLSSKIVLNFFEINITVKVAWLIIWTINKTDFRHFNIIGINFLFLSSIKVIIIFKFRLLVYVVVFFLILWVTRTFISENSDNADF